MEASINPMAIPFNKAERVSNFKIWRTKSTITRVPTPEEREEIKKKSNGTRKAKSVSYPIECIHISNLLGGWSISIPQSMEMFGYLTQLYADWKNEEKTKEERDGSFNALRTLLSNMLYVTSVGNGYFHHGVEIVSAIYARPTILDKKDEKHDYLINDVKRTCKEYQEWRAAYDAEMAKHEPTEEELKQDEIAEQASEVLDK